MPVVPAKAGEKRPIDNGLASAGSSLLSHLSFLHEEQGSRTQQGLVGTAATSNNANHATGLAADNFLGA